MSTPASPSKINIQGSIDITKSIDHLITKYIAGRGGSSLESFFTNNIQSNILAPIFANIHETLKKTKIAIDEPAALNLNISTLIADSFSNIKVDKDQINIINKSINKKFIDLNKSILDSNFTEKILNEFTKASVNLELNLPKFDFKNQIDKDRVNTLSDKVLKVIENDIDGIKFNTKKFNLDKIFKNIFNIDPEISADTSRKYTKLINRVLDNFAKNIDILNIDSEPISQQKLINILFDASPDRSMGPLTWLKYSNLKSSLLEKLTKSIESIEAVNFDKTNLKFKDIVDLVLDSPPAGDVLSLWYWKKYRDIKSNTLDLIINATKSLETIEIKNKLDIRDLIDLVLDAPPGEGLINLLHWNKYKNLKAGILEKLTKATLTTLDNANINNNLDLKDIINLVLDTPPAGSPLTYFAYNSLKKSVINKLENIVKLLDIDFIAKTAKLEEPENITAPAKKSAATAADTALERDKKEEELVEESDREKGTVFDVPEIKLSAETLKKLSADRVLDFIKGDLLTNSHFSKQIQLIVEKFDTYREDIVSKLNNNNNSSAFKDLLVGGGLLALLKNLNLKSLAKKFPALKRVRSAVVNTKRKSRQLISKAKNAASTAARKITEPAKKVIEKASKTKAGQIAAPIIKKLTENIPKLSKIIPNVGKKIPLISGGFYAYDAYSQISDAEEEFKKGKITEEEFKQKKAAAVGSAVGGTIGSIATAPLMATGIGTAAAIAGTMGASYLGEKAGEWLYKPDKTLSPQIEPSKSTADPTAEPTADPTAEPSKKPIEESVPSIDIDKLKTPELKIDLSRIPTTTNEAITDQINFDPLLKGLEPAFNAMFTSMQSLQQNLIAIANILAQINQKNGLQTSNTTSSTISRDSSGPLEYTNAESDSFGGDLIKSYRSSYSTTRIGAIV